MFDKSPVNGPADRGEISGIPRDTERLLVRGIGAGVQSAGQAMRRGGKGVAGLGEACEKRRRGFSRAREQAQFPAQKVLLFRGST